MINIDVETDTTNGRSAFRQISVILTNIVLILASWYFIYFLQWIVISKIANRDDFWNISYKEGLYTIINWILFSILWIILQERTWVVVKGNGVLPTVNILFPEFLEEGGNRFICYPAGISFTFPWEIRGTVVDVEKEEIETTPSDDPHTIIARSISLEIRVALMYRIYLPALSKFLQIITHFDDFQKNIRFLLQRAEQEVEGLCTNAVEITNQLYNCNLTVSDGQKFLSIEDVQRQQTLILDIVHYMIIPEAHELGVHPVKLVFEKCDLPKDLQASLNKQRVAETVKAIAMEIFVSGNGTVKMDDAMSLAAQMAGVDGFKRDHTVFEFRASEELSSALGSAGPVIAEILRRLKNRP